MLRIAPPITAGKEELSRTKVIRLERLIGDDTFYSFYGNIVDEFIALVYELFYIIINIKKEHLITLKNVDVQRTKNKIKNVEGRST